MFWVASFVTLAPIGRTKFPVPPVHNHLIQSIRVYFVSLVVAKARRWVHESCESGVLWTCSRLAAKGEPVGLETKVLKMSEELHAACPYLTNSGGGVGVEKLGNMQISNVG